MKIDEWRFYYHFHCKNFGKIFLEQSMLTPVQMCLSLNETDFIAKNVSYDLYFFPKIYLSAKNQQKGKKQFSFDAGKLRIKKSMSDAARQSDKVVI